MLAALHAAIRAGRETLTAELPTFGGAEPESTDRVSAEDRRAVWSWDARRLLVGTCAEDLAIIPRE